MITDSVFRITSYNVCYTKLLRTNLAADEWTIAVVGMVHHAITAGQGHEIRRITNQAAGRNQEFKTDLAVATIDHVHHFCFTGTEAFHN